MARAGRALEGGAAETASGSRLLVAPTGVRRSAHVDRDASPGAGRCSAPRRCARSARRPARARAHALGHARDRLRLLGPAATLERGYAVVQDAAGAVVSDAAARLGRRRGGDPAGARQPRGDRRPRCASERRAHLRAGPRGARADRPASWRTAARRSTRRCGCGSAASAARAVPGAARPGREAGGRTRRAPGHTAAERQLGARPPPARGRLARSGPGVVCGLLRGGTLVTASDEHGRIAAPERRSPAVRGPVNDGRTARCRSHSPRSPCWSPRPPPRPRPTPCAERRHPHRDRPGHHSRAAPARAHQPHSGLRHAPHRRGAAGARPRPPASPAVTIAATTSAHRHTCGRTSHHCAAASTPCARANRSH